MGQRPSFDVSRMSNADKLIAGGAGLYLIWSFLPVWYKFEFATVLGLEGTSLSAWRGVTFLAALLSLLALVWVGMRIAGVNLNLNVKPGLVDLVLGGLGLLLTILGLLVKPALHGVSWGFFIGIILAIVWAYGAYMKYNEPAA